MMKRLFSIYMIFACTISMLQAKVVLPGLFADNMVLQQETEAALWGKAEPGAKVTIVGSWSKSKVAVTADADG